MLVASRDITPGNVGWLRGAATVEVLNISYGIAHIPDLLPVRVMGDSSPSSTTRIEVGRRLT